MNDVLFVRRGLLPVILGNALIPIAEEGEEDLLEGETDGLAIDWTATSDFALSTWAMQAVQERNASVDTLQSPHVFFTQSGTSPKYVKASATTISWSPHNLVLQSQTINTGWGIGTGSFTANSTTSPDGTATADTATFNASASMTQLVTPTPANILYTVSIYLKYVDSQWVGVMLRGVASGDRVRGFFDIQNGVLGSSSVTGGGVYATHTMTSMGSGWYRCSTTGYISAADDLQHSTFVTASDGDVNAGSGSVYVWGAQLNRGFPTAYIATTTAARIGLPISYGEGLLVEPAATNLAVRSEDLATTWVNGQSSEATNTTTAPDGSTTADTLIEGSDVGGFHYIRQQFANGGVQTTYTFSVYAKAKERTQVNLFVGTSGAGSAAVDGFDLTDGGAPTGGSNYGSNFTYISSDNEDVGNGWCRCIITATCSAAVTDFYVLMVTVAGGTDTYNGDGTSGLYLWGMQLETGTVATSYVPTVAATATRAKDAGVSVTVSAFPYANSAANSVIQWVTPRIVNDAVFGRIFEFDDGSGSDIVLSGAIVGDTPDRFGFAVTVGGVAQVAAGTTKTGSYNTAGNKVGTAWATNNSGIVVDGSVEVTDTSCSVPTGITNLRLGWSFLTNDREFNGFIRRFITVPRRMTEAQMQAKTT